MTNDYAAVWERLPETLRTALTAAGAPPTLAFWLTRGPGPTDRFEIASTFSAWITNHTGNR